MGLFDFLKGKNSFDPELLRRAMEDPENLGKHILPPEQYQNFQEILARLERGYDARTIGSEKALEECGSLLKIFSSASPEYVPYLMAWGTQKVKSLVDGVMFRRTLRQFYEEMPVGSCATIGNSKELEARAFVREGDEFYILGMKWPKINIIRDDKAKTTQVSALRPEVRELERSPWTADYKSLANKIDAAEKYSRILAHAPRDSIPDNRDRIISDVMFANYMMFSERKGD